MLLKHNLRLAAREMNIVPGLHSTLVSDVGPLINLGTQHDGRSARTWMKRV